MRNESNISIETALATFLAALVGRNRSGATITAYRIDLRQFIAYLHENDATVRAASDVGRPHITEYLTHLSQEHGLSGVTRARKLAAIKEYFRFLVAEELLVMTVFLQTGLRVGELCALTTEDIDLVAGTLRVRCGKGQASREIDLEKRAVKALRTHLKDRGEVSSVGILLPR